MKPLKILIISTFFPPLNSIASLRPYSWAKYWSEEGHDVTVLTTKKHQDPELNLTITNNGFTVLEVPSLSIFESAKKEKKSTPQNKTSTSKSFISLIKKACSKIKWRTGIFHACRFPDMTHFWIGKAGKKVKDLGPWDLVVSTSGPYTVHVLAEKLKRKGKAKKWIADYRDKWVDHHNFPGLWPFTILEKFWEKKLMRSADAIVTVSKPYAKSFKEKYGNKVHVVQNGFDPADLSKIPPIPIFFEDGKYRIVHTGSIYLRHQHPELLFQAINLINQNPENKELLDRLEVIFVGPNNEPIEKLTHSHHVEKWVKVHGFVNREIALRMQRDAHSLLFFHWSDSQSEGAISGKIFEYLYSDTPIMCVGEDPSHTLKESMGTMLAKPEQIAEHLIEVLTNNKKENANHPKELLDLYHRKNLALKFLEIAQGDKNEESFQLLSDTCHS